MINFPIFKNAELQQQIEANGYCVTPFADENVLAELREFYRALDNMPLKGTHVTMFNPSYEYRKLVDDKIKQVCATLAEQLMVDYRVLYTNFMTKEPGVEGDFPVHQDWTYVDESKFSSYAFWIPMCDVNDINGALHVVNGSHRFITALRGPYVYEPFTQITDAIKIIYSLPINIRAGEAMIWDHRLIHFSRPNKTSEARLAFTLIMVPVNAAVIHCFGVDGSPTDEIEIYDIDTDFFMRYTISERPEGAPLINKVMQPRVDFTLPEFDKLFSMMNSKE